MRARGGESWRRRVGKGGGDDAMFGNRCLRAHAQGTTRVVGGAWGGWVGERREGGALAPGTQRPQRLSTVAALRLPSETSLYLVFLRSSWSAHLAVAPVLSPP